MNQNEIQQLLQFREDCYIKACQLSDLYQNPVITLTINQPGLQKTITSSRLFRLTYQEIQHLFYPILHTECTHSISGECAFVVPSKRDVSSLKEIAMRYEDTAPHGRLVDLDVLDKECTYLQRQNKRRCIVCGGNTTLCRQHKNHTIDEVMQSFHQLANKKAITLQNHLAGLAHQALLLELITTPKPGLVDTNNSGAHQDMDYRSFLSSAGILTHYFQRCAEIGFSGVDVLTRIRIEGIIAESEMYKVTNGVNTHKGAIFTLGLCVAATASLYYAFPSLQQIGEVIKTYTKGISLELDEADTHGGIIFRKYGRTGARGEVEEGLPHVQTAFHIFQTTLLETKDWNGAAVLCLLHLIQNISDTNILYRKDMETLQYVQRQAKKAFQQNGLFTQKGTQFLEEMDAEFCQRGISPGGSADLLSVVFFFSLFFEKQ